MKESMIYEKNPLHTFFLSKILSILKYFCIILYLGKTAFAIIFSFGWIIHTK